MRARWVDWGRLSYSEAYDRQLALVEKVQLGEPSTLVFVEHPPVLTLGANFHSENLLFETERYRTQGIEVLRTDRGGDVTYHGPGQVVVYPIFDVSLLGKDLHRWLRDLEETMICTVAALGLTARRFPPHTGAWIGDKKVAAIGIKIKRWVSMHGIALNANVDLRPFASIIPCGISGYGVTSLSEATGHEITPEQVKPLVREAFQQVFKIAWQP